MSTPPLSVVVPTKDPWPGLKDCLDALLDQVSETGAELIVVYGSGGGLPADEASPYRRVKLVRAPGESVFDLRVRGVDASRGDLLAVTEDHCVVNGDWCAEIIEAHRRHPDAAAIAGAIENGSTERFMDWANFLPEPDVRQASEHLPPPEPGHRAAVEELWHSLTGGLHRVAVGAHQRDGIVGHRPLHQGAGMGRRPVEPGVRLKQSERDSAGVEGGGGQPPSLADAELVAKVAHGVDCRRRAVAVCGP